MRIRFPSIFIQAVRDPLTVSHEVSSATGITKSAQYAIARQLNEDKTMKMKMAPTLIALAICVWEPPPLRRPTTGTRVWVQVGPMATTWIPSARMLTKDATALSLFGGYNFTENFAAELGYLYAGKAGVDGVDFKTQGATCPVSHACP